MFTQAEAEVFIKALLEDVFPHGKVESLDNFYTRDVVGHFQGTLYFDDIVDRVLAIQKTTAECNFVVQKVVVFDQFIAMSCKQSWTNKSDGAFHDSLVFAIYRIKDKKIAELWGFIDGETAPYQEINQNFEDSMKSFKITQRTKNAFLQRLINVPLSTVEKECLYYYLHGVSAKEAALTLNLSPRTIETYLAEIKEKLQCHTKSELRKKFFPEKIK